MMKRPVFFRVLLTSTTILLAAAPLADAAVGKMLKPTTKTRTSDDVSDRHMGDHTGVKHAIGVLDFENQGGYYSNYSLGQNLGLMLESALFETGRFIIVERGELGAVMAEQDIQASNRSAAATNVAGSGNIRSARYLATGAVTEASQETSGETGGIRIKGFRIGGSSSKASMVVLVKLIDTTTGEVVASERIRGEAGKTALNLGYAGSQLGGKLGAFAKTPLAEAAQVCIDDAVEFIANSMADFEVEGAVVTVSGSNIIINMGENRGVGEGQTFIVRTDGEVLTDPMTGEILDRIEGEIIATIEVTKVREKIAYCKLLDGQMPERGATVIFQ